MTKYCLRRQRGATPLLPWDESDFLQILCVSARAVGWIASTINSDGPLVGLPFILESVLGSTLLWTRRIESTLLTFEGRSPVLGTNR